MRAQGFWSILGGLTAALATSCGKSSLTGGQSSLSEGQKPSAPVG